MVFPDNPAEAGTVFADLPLGTYRLLEVAAPAGYQTLFSPIEFTIPYVDTQGVSHYDLTFTVEDSAEVVLPTSGGAFTAEHMVFIGLGIILLAVAAYVIRSVAKNRAQKEKEKPPPD